MSETGAERESVLSTYHNYFILLSSSIQPQTPEKDYLNLHSRLNLQSDVYHHNPHDCQMTLWMLDLV